MLEWKLLYGLLGEPVVKVSPQNFSVYTLLTAVWLVFMLQCLISPVFMTASILHNMPGNSLVVYLLKLAKMKQFLVADLSSFQGLI